MRDQRWKVGACVAAVAAIAWACGSDVVEDVGDAMVDSGRAMVDGGRAIEDAGRALRDTGTDAARAQVVAECSIRDGATWFADAMIDVDPATVTRAHAVMCDLEGRPPIDTGLGCASANVFFDASRARVVCGAGMDPAALEGYRYRSVRIFVE